MPLALRATLVNEVIGAGDENEQALYRRLKRAMLAPQGIGVLDSGGRVRAWVQMFDDDRSVLDFLDRYKSGAAAPRRFMKFPGESKGDIDDDGPPIDADVHATCPAKAQAKSNAPKGTLAAQLVGRRLDAKGAFIADAVRQENYVQDQFTIPSDVQETAVRALADGKPLPRAFGRLCAIPAHLGHIDVRPIFGNNEGDLMTCEFTAKKEGERLWRIEGKTDVAAVLKINGAGVHDVTLSWTGFIETDGARISRLLLFARGTETLQFNKNGPRPDEVASLPAGRPIDFTSDVRYGVVGTPGTADEAPAEHGAAPPESIQRKMERLQKHARKWESVGRIMQKFEPLMRDGKFKEAEAILDEALKIAEADE